MAQSFFEKVLFPLPGHPNTITLFPNTVIPAFYFTTLTHSIP